MSKISPFLHYQDEDPLPSTIFGGRFPIDVWPRPLMLAFKWQNIEKNDPAQTRPTALLLSVLV